MRRVSEWREKSKKMKLNLNWKNKLRIELIKPGRNERLFMGADSMCGIGNIFISDNLLEGMKVSLPVTDKHNIFITSNSILGRIASRPMKIAKSKSHHQTKTSTHSIEFNEHTTDTNLVKTAKKHFSFSCPGPLSKSMCRISRWNWNGMTVEVWAWAHGRMSYS